MKPPLSAPLFGDKPFLVATQAGVYGEHMSGLIAIVGRPNVGKSALFNRIVGRRIAIVHDEPGVTRDRISAEAEWHGRPFTLVDTGGIGLLRGEKAKDPIALAAFQQVQIAIDAAQVILLVVNVQEGLAPLDQEVASRLRQSGKPVLVVANKVDSQKAEPDMDEFARLGFDRVFPVSAIHGRGIEPLMEAAIDQLPKLALPATSRSATAADSAPPLKLAIVGRPNVGKSSIINALTQSERVIVTPIPGTTRDAVDVPFEVVTEGVRQKYVLIDTAGVRKERRVHDSIEFYSIRRTEDSIDRSDIVVLMLDAESGVLEQDKKVADKIVESRKACILVVNKWDLVSQEVEEHQKKQGAKKPKFRKDGAPETLSTLAEFGKWVQEKLFFLSYAPVIFTSAKSGFHLDRLLEAVRYVGAQLQQKIPTALLNRTLNAAIENRQPVSNQGHRLKFFYATQVRLAPPTFLLFVNADELFSDTYAKYLSGELRKAFGYEGCPLVLVPKPRPKTIASVRRSKQHR
jgi:GTP-binding protein